MQKHAFLMQNTANRPFWGREKCFAERESGYQEFGGAFAPEKTLLDSGSSPE
jgi:hypothetical protein